jgi:DNA modification methylase
MQKPDCDVQQASCQTEETIREAEEMKIDISENVIVCGDNMKWLDDVPKGSVDLCYIDPPFFSNANYEVIWGNGYEIRSFADRFEGDITHYQDWMRKRVDKIKRTLKPTGSILLHCDYHANHYLRKVLDDIFGYNNFRGEIIWHYNTFHGKEDKKSPAIPIKHDNIYWYSVGETFTYNPTFDSSLDELADFKRWKKYIVEGKIYGNNMPIQDTRFVRYLNKFIKENKRSPNPDEVVYSLVGQAEDDIWDIPAINPNDCTERLGYKTQKPKSLLMHLINTCSNKGDLVLDCFAGAGTTAEAAYLLDRKFIVGDVSPVAVRICSERLHRAEICFSICNLPQTIEQLNEIKGYAFQKLVCDVKGWDCGPQGGDGGADGTDGIGDPIEIKKGDATPGQIRNFITAMRSRHKTRGVFVAAHFTHGCVEEIAKAKENDNIIIEKVSWLDALSPIIINDIERKKIENHYKERFPENCTANLF